MGEQKRGGVILFGGGVAISVPFSPIKPIQISWNIQPILIIILCRAKNSLIPLCSLAVEMVKN